MAMDKKYIKGYQDGRAAGMRVAYQDIKNGGIKELEKDMNFRARTKINTDLAMAEIETASEPMRSFINEGHILVWLSVLHDEFDFGEKRLNRACDRFESIYGSITDGYAGWSDYIELLNGVMKKVFKSRFLQKDGNWKKDPEK